MATYRLSVALASEIPAENEVELLKEVFTLARYLDSHSAFSLEYTLVNEETGEVTLVDLTAHTEYDDQGTTLLMGPDGEILATEYDDEYDDEEESV